MRAALDKLIASLGLGLDGESQRQRLREDPGKAEQISRLAALQLELELGDWASAFAGQDLALIKRDLDFRLATRNEISLASYRRHKQWPQGCPHFSRHERRKRCAFGVLELRAGGGNLPLPLEALHRLGLASHRLHSLHVAYSGIADAEIDAGLAQGEVGGIEIDRDQIALFGRDESVPQQGVRSNPRGIRKVELELELDLFRMTRRLVGRHLPPPMSSLWPQAPKEPEP